MLPESSVSPGPLLTGHDGQKTPAVKLFAPTVAPSPALGTAAAARSALVLTKSWNGCTRPPKAVTSAKTRLLENLLESALPVRKKPPNPTVLRSQQGAELSLPHFQRVQGAWLSEEGTSGGENQSAPKPSHARGAPPPRFLLSELPRRARAGTAVGDSVGREGWLSPGCFCRAENNPVGHRKLSRTNIYMSHHTMGH